MRVMKDAWIVACGGALVVGATTLVLLRAPVPISTFTLTFGIGVVLSSRFVLHNARLRSTVLVILVVAFAAYRLGDLFASGVTGLRVAVLVVEVVMLAVVFALGYEHAHGLAHLVTLFARADAGYAPVLEERDAARTVEAELARSRRHGTPLTFLLLEPAAEVRSEDFAAAAGRVASRALDELEHVYVRDRAGALISDHVRRSDIVVSWQDRFLVMSGDTSADGTAILASRMVDAARGQLGLALRRGVAAFPSHGSTFAELLAVAAAAARSDGNGHGDGAFATDDDETPTDEPPLRIVGGEGRARESRPSSSASP